MRAPFRLRLAGWGFSSVPPRTVKKSPPGQTQPEWATHKVWGTTFNPIGGWPTPRFYRELLNRVPHSAFGWRGGAFRLSRHEPSRNPPRANPARMGHPRSMGTTFNPIGGWPTPRFYRELLNRVPHSPSVGGVGLFVCPATNRQEIPTRANPARVGHPQRYGAPHSTQSAGGPPRDSIENFSIGCPIPPSVGGVGLFVCPATDRQEIPTRANPARVGHPIGGYSRNTIGGPASPFPSVCAL